MLGQSQSGIASLSKQSMQRTSRASNHFWTETIRIKARALQNRCNYTHNWGFTTINPDPDPDPVSSHRSRGLDLVFVEHS